MQTFTSFQELAAWQAARDLRRMVSAAVKRFPAKEQFRLTDQIIRSSRSVPTNIAEGFGRFHFQENIQYCRQARGSLEETLEHCECAFDEEYIDAETLASLNSQIGVCRKILNGYILYLQKAKHNNPVTQ